MAARKRTRASARKITKRKTSRQSKRKALAKAKKGIETVGKRAAEIGDVAVRKATGKPMRHWFALLDRAGAKAMDHGAITAILGKARGVSGWWQQMITVAYERARGLRRKYETTTGFTAGSSKTVAASVDQLYDAWMDEATQRAWLGVPAPDVRTAQPGRSLRLTWHDGSWVIVGFTDKGDGKSQVTVSHERLPNAKSANKYRAFWKEALARLQVMLEAPAI
jgi:uncharacterized protein YndB with AHSA1/START domain